MGIRLKKMIPVELKNFIRNFRNLPYLKQEITELKRGVLFLRILHYFENNDPDRFKTELEFLKKSGELTTYPYKKTDKELKEIVTGYDKNKSMPFIVHKEKRLYFPDRFSQETAKEMYLNLIVRENILGDGFMEKSPHSYLSESFSINSDDIVVDVGACEGLFSLDSIEKAKRCFIIEPKKHWLKALKATFGPYEGKVSIIKKFASDKNSNDEIKLDTCLENETGSIFIKIDVEGSEFSVLSGAKEVLGRNTNIRVACATYHRHDDAGFFEDYFRSINYRTEFSCGYMLFALYDKIQPPFFRKGIIRAENSKKNM